MNNSMAMNRFTDKVSHAKTSFELSCSACVHATQAVFVITTCQYSQQRIHAARPACADFLRRRAE